LTDSTDDEK